MTDILYFKRECAREFQEVLLVWFKFQAKIPSHSGVYV